MDDATFAAANIKPAGELEKVPTGIQGFDEITFGGLPRRRTTLVCGGPGSGKTLFAMEFVVRGAVEMNAPGVFMSFEESAEALASNMASLGMDIPRLVAEKKLALNHVRIERGELEEAGDYDLEGIFIRLGRAIDTVGAKRVALDTLESLFGAFQNEVILRAELRRLFGWLADRGVTSVVTGERGGELLTRHGIEEYASDCVILLDQRVEDRIATRYMRIVKYRGSRHGSNEYPFLIHQRGITVQPITTLTLDHPTSTERISIGVPRIDAMLGGGDGLYRGSTVLISGAAGSGKSSLAAYAADATCRRGERCLYFAYEEPRLQIIRNMRSIGLDLQPHQEAGLLRFQAARPTTSGLEMHLVTMQQQIMDFNPQLVIVDPITGMLTVGKAADVLGMLTRLVDLLKSRLITAIFTSLTHAGEPKESSEVGVSSLMDTWLLLQLAEQNNERNRLLYVLKSRGMAHSNQVRELIFTEHGIEPADVYVGPAGGIVVGAARHTEEARDRARSLERTQRIERLKRDVARKKQMLDARLAMLRAQFENAEEQLLGEIADEQRADELESQARTTMAGIRQADVQKPSGEQKNTTKKGVS